MKLFKKDLNDIFMRNFADMTVAEFLSLDEIPKGVTEEEMINLNNFIQNERAIAKKKGVTVESKTLGELFLIYLERVGELEVIE
jgi:hypothetical protein